MILLSCFESFDGAGLNSSQEALNGFRRRHAEASAVRCVTLPVKYDLDFATLRPHIEDLAPDFIILLGQSARPAIAVETRGVNEKAIAGASGEHATTQFVAILPETPAHYESTLPSAQMVAALLARGIPSCRSDDGGRCMCNHILFRTLHHMAANELTSRVGFIHLPLLPQLAAMKKDEATGPPSMSLELTVEALSVVAELLARA